MVFRKIAPIILLLLALWLLKDGESKRLAVRIALERHPPALRVFRGLFEISLILFGAALSLYIWVEAVGTTVVGQLLFLPPTQPEEKTRGRYHRISALDQDENLVEDDDDDDDVLEEAELEQRKPMVPESEMMDADYASDGEVDVGHVDEPEIEATPPTPLAMLEIAVDLLLWVLVSLFLFTLSSAGGGRYIDGMQDLTELQIMANVAAPVIPLLLFVGALVRIILPWNKRKSFWIILFTTIGAPFCSVTFRDGFVGDVLTSSVRPMQDVAFTGFYILSGLQGWWTQAYDLDGAALPVERSWIVHTVVLPACMVSPLWWRFNQNLRQVWDSKKRWPYLGNALKYLAAAEVAMFGVFDPLRRTSPIWLVCAVIATLYQVWWDVVMDWDLIRLDKGNKIRLRDQRLYESKRMYWTILIVNLILRFGWTMTFLPNKFLDRTGVLQRTTEGIFQYVDPLLASAEILRRTLWGFIRLELEAINSHGDNPKVKMQLRKCSSRDDCGDMELQPMNDTDRIRPPAFDGRDMKFDFSDDVFDKRNVRILVELCLWTGVFCAGGILAAAHRGTY